MSVMVQKKAFKQAHAKFMTGNQLLRDEISTLTSQVLDLESQRDAHLEKSMWERLSAYLLCVAAYIFPLHPPPPAPAQSRGSGTFKPPLPPGPPLCTRHGESASSRAKDAASSVVAGSGWPMCSRRHVLIPATSTRLGIHSAVCGRCFA